MPTLAIAIFIGVFAVATIRNIHLGVLMLPGAVAVGIWLADMPVPDILDGFPINILVLIAGVTYFFGIAQGNGTIDAVIQRLIAAVGDRRGLLPFLVFLITTGIASMGSSQAGYVMIPLAMAAARRSNVDPVVMGVALNSGMCTGGFAPTSLLGIVTVTTAVEAGINLNPLTLLAAAAVSNLALLLVAAWMFSRPSTATVSRAATIEPQTKAGLAPLAFHQIVTLVAIAVLIICVVAGYSLGYTPDLGIIAFGLGAILAFIWPEAGVEGIRRIDWPTIFMVGGIVTFVGVLQNLDAVNLLGLAAMNVGTPLMAAFVICAIAGLVSAFASTVGILAALVPMAVPLATSGGVVGWALMCAMGVCASIVDVSPYSTTGALIIASGAESDRARLRSLLMRWGMSLVIVGPIAAVLVLMLL